MEIEDSAASAEKFTHTTKNIRRGAGPPTVSGPVSQEVADTLHTTSTPVTHDVCILDVIDEYIEVVFKRVSTRRYGRVRNEPPKRSTKESSVNLCKPKKSHIRRPKMPVARIKTFDGQFT